MTSPNYPIRALFLLLTGPLVPMVSQGQTTDTSFTVPGTHTITIPPGVGRITVEAWGGGGRGGNVLGGNSSRAGGGGGGAYVQQVLTVTPGTYTLEVGAGGNGTTAPGGDSWFGSSTTLLAKGGSPGQEVSLNGSESAGGPGGQASDCLPGSASRYSGGDGAIPPSEGASTRPAGGGGGSAGPGPGGTGVAGNAGSAPAGGAAVVGGGAGGAGGTNPGGNVAPGSPGTAPGGGGGGGARGGVNAPPTTTGGDGARGQVRVTYTLGSSVLPDSTIVLDPGIPGPGTITIPPGITQVLVEAWGGGGRGGNATGGVRSYGGGGGGGAYVNHALGVTPGVYTVAVGAGGNGATASGGDTWFDSPTTLLAKGGSAGGDVTSATNGAGGPGGQAADCLPLAASRSSGGNGGTSQGSDITRPAAGGGSSAGPGPAGTGVAGNNGSTPLGGAAVIGGGAGGDGANPVTSTADLPGSPGAAPGGGGGGARRYTQNMTGGDGGNGRLRVTYILPSYGITVCAGNPATDLFSLLGGSLPTTGAWGGPSPLGNGHLGTFTPGTSLVGTYAYGTGLDVMAIVTVSVDPACTGIADFNKASWQARWLGQDADGSHLIEVTGAAVQGWEALDATGRVVAAETGRHRRTTNGRFRVALHGQAPGLHVVRVLTDHGMTTVRLMHAR